MLTPLKFFVFVAILTLPMTGNAAADSKAPREIVTTFQTALVETMQEALFLAPDERYGKLAPAIDTAFHIEEGAALVSTPHWRKTDDPGRAEMAKAFRHLSVSTLATRFDGYDGQNFVIIDEKDGPRETHIVRTEIVDPDQTKRSVAYILKNVDDRWGIIDIIVDGGISELSIRRSEYKDILRSDGISGMAKAMMAKGNDLLTQ